jgi:ribosomal protein L21E
LFFLEDGVLWVKNRSDFDKALVVPESLKESILRLNHDIPSSGHQGIGRMKAKLKAKYYWAGMRVDLEQYILTCPTCNQNKKGNRIPKCSLTNFHSGSPMERVHLDFLGPLKKTKSGNEYILMMVDQFTKWVECIPLPSQTAEITAHAAINEFFTRFGYPFEIFTDQGRKFESILFKSICDLLKIHKARSTPYRPSGNGQVERYNRTLMDAVRCYVDKNQNDWDKYLSQIASAMRSCVNRQTGFTPNKLMLGREINHPVDLMYPVHKLEKFLNMDDYVVETEKAIKIAHNVARQNLRSSQKRMKRDYDLRLNIKQYKPGDMVYILDSAQQKGTCKKLAPPWKGPGIIIEKLTPYLYRIKLQRAVFVSNHDKLAPCKSREIPKWLEKYQNNFSLLLKNIPKLDTDGKCSTLYCLCRKPYSGQFMINCDYCQEWFHGVCVNVSAEDAVDIVKYKCPLCAKS